MELESVRRCISEPNVCRCCLTANGSCDLLASYINKVGEKEIYCDILRDTFGIHLSYMNDWDASHFICELCMEHLQDANKFKKQVLQAEEQFVVYIKNVRDEQVKLNANLACYKQDDVSQDSDCDNEEFTLEVTNNTKVKDKVKFKKENNTEEDNFVKSIITESNISTNKPKQLSERKRIRLTCDVILKNTTACPFRHYKSWFQCFYCTLEFMEIDSIRQHIRETHTDAGKELKNIKRYPRSLQIDITVLQCLLCQLILKDIDSAVTHFVDVHNKVIYKECIADYKVNSSPYTCHICGKQFHVFRTLTTHLNEHYANCICDICGKSFINTKRLKVHKRTHENGNFPCSVCGKILKTKSSIANHMQSAHSKHVIKCQICYKPMKHYNDRVKHMSEVHDITHKFKCPICAREYNIKHYLATHMRQSHGHKNKKCLECGMGFITNHSLKKHMQKHSGVKSFNCDICNKSYARSYTLKEHMRGHEVEKGFQVE